MLKELLQPSLIAKEIIVRTDKGEDTSEVERFIGSSYPLVRILDRTVEQGNLLEFKYNIGRNFLPEVDIRIQDDEYRLREILKSNIDTITVYLSNNIDGTFSKQEYIITYVDSSPEDETITLNGILYVPNFFKRDMRAFEGTSMDVLKKICTETGLGLSTNITPNDKMVRIQDNSTNLDFIRNVISTAQCAAVHAFIDQWSFLNFVDMKIAYGTKDVINYTINPFSGEPLSKPQDLVLSNNRIDTEIVGKIAFWAAADEYGLKSLSYVNAYDVENFNLVELDKTTNTNVPAQAEEIRDSKRKLLSESDNVWSGYFLSKHYNWFTKDTLNQSSELKLRMQYPLHALHAGLSLPVEIYNTQKRTDSYNQTDKEITLIDMPQVTGEEMLKLTKNELYSGQYYLSSTEMIYYSERIEQRLYLRQI